MMPALLRLLGVVVLVVGLAVGAAAGWWFATDADFHKVAAAYARHPEHPIFRTEYWAAALRHYGLLAASVGGLLGGLSLGGILLALGELLARGRAQPAVSAFGAVESRSPPRA